MLTVTVTAGHNFPADIPVTLGALRKAALPSISIGGSVGTGDIADGAVTAAKSAPGAFWFGTALWSDPTYSLTLSPALTGLANGVEVWMKTPTGGTNTVSSTLNVNSLGAKTIYKQNGETLVAGDLRENCVYGFRYNASLGSGAGGWQVFTPLGNANRFVTTTGSANAYVYTNGATPNTPTVTGLNALQGVPIYFKANFTNTAAATLNVDGLGAKSIRKRGDLALTGGEIKLNQIVAVVYDSALNGATGGFMLLSWDEPMLVGVSRNLLVAIATVSTVDIDADEVILRGEAHDHYRASAVNLTVDITGSGPNGLDTGTEAGDGPSTKYYLWVIWNGTTVAGLLSKSSTAPTMPSGYTHKGLVGAVFNNGSSDFDRFWEFRERWRFVSNPVAPLDVAGKPLDVAHGLGATPRLIRTYMRCKTADRGYAVGDIVGVESGHNSTNYRQVLMGANSTNVWFLQATTIELIDKGTYAFGAITLANWELFAVCEL